MVRLWKVLGYGVMGVGLVGLCLVGLIFLSFLNPYLHSPPDVQAEFDRIRGDLPGTRARWQALDIRDYDVEVRVGAGFCFVDLTLEVRDGLLSRVIKHEQDMETGGRTGEISFILVDGLPSSCPSASDLTISGMFDLVERNLSRFNASEEFMFVEFDPELGFIREYREGTNRNQVGECCRTIIYRNFHPISP